MQKYKLTATEEIVLEVIMKYAKKQEKVSVNVISKESFVSPATIIKLSKKMGYSGYSELYYSLSKKEKKQFISIDFNDYKGLSTISKDIDIKLIAELLYNYRNSKMILASTGYCDSAKDYLLQKLWSFSFRAMDTYHREAVNSEKVQKGLFFIFSESGNLNSLIERCEEAIDNNYNIIVFTSDTNSKLAKLSHLTIYIESNKRENYEYYTANLFTAKIIVFIELLFEEYSRLNCMINKKNE